MQRATIAGKLAFAMLVLLAASCTRSTPGGYEDPFVSRLPVAPHAIMMIRCDPGEITVVLTNQYAMGTGRYVESARQGRKGVDFPTNPVFVVEMIDPVSDDGTTEPYRPPIVFRADARSSFGEVWQLVRQYSIASRYLRFDVRRPDCEWSKHIFFFMATNPPPDSAVTITKTPATTTLNGKPCDRTQLVQWFRDSGVYRPDVYVSIASNVVYQDAITLLDALEEGGHSHVTFLSVMQEGTVPSAPPE